MGVNKLINKCVTTYQELKIYITLKLFKTKAFNKGGW